MRHKALWAATTAALMALALAATLGCGSITGMAGQDSAADAHADRPDEVELIKGPVSPDGLQAIFATPDISAGEQRIAVVLTSEQGLVRSPLATLTALYYPDAASDGERRDTAVAEFRPFPLGTRGLYAAQMNFDAPGDWGLDIAVIDENANTLRAELRFQVPAQTIAPAIGAPAPASASKTIHDTALDDLTTGTLRDTDLYRISIADAIQSDLPAVIVMASPAFCTNAVCGPQVDVLSQLKNKHPGRAHFIHIDFYDNPSEIQGDLTRARLSPTVREWNLPSAEWSFILDASGVIRQRFEGFAPLDELEDSLLDVLG